MTELAGVLNVTPDSFSDGEQFLEPKKAIEQAHKMFQYGAAFIDIGAESTRPGATPITAGEEWKRLEPVLTDLLKEYPKQLSVDTYHPETAEKALQLGDVIINNVTGHNDPALVKVILKHKPRVIVSHLAGNDPQAAHQGKLIDDQSQIKKHLLEKAKYLEENGIKRSRIILDPGIGFGKTPELNWILLRFAEQLPEYKVMIGYSKKRFLGDNRYDVETNLAAGRIAIASGAAYIRVHDVAAHQKLLY